jgi:hypothetical protein
MNCTNHDLSPLISDSSSPARQERPDAASAAAVGFSEPAIDATAIVTQAMIWVLCWVLTALGAVITWAVKTYIIPWLKDVAVPWLE